MWGCGMIHFVDELRPREVAAFWLAGLALSAVMAPTILCNAQGYWDWVRSLLTPRLW